MKESETQPRLTTADMAMAEDGWDPDQREAFASLLNWTPKTELTISERYQLTRFLGRGGFGLVYEARDLLENRPVALKFIHPGQINHPRKTRRIEREFEIASRVRHPALVRLHRLDCWQGIHYLLMDFIDGETVSDWIEREGAQPWLRVAPLLEQLLDVLSLMHSLGIVHRDIKPSNLILTPEGKLVLLDLGLTRDLEDTQKTASTGELVGSPHYMPPELILGHPVTPASDLYQLGLVIFYLLSGNHPYMEEEFGTSGILSRQVSCTLHLPKAKGLAFATRLTLQRCLEKEPKMRPRDARALKRQLKYNNSIAWLLHRLSLRRSTRQIILVLSGLVLSLFTLLWFTLPADHIEESDQTLIARNQLGHERWQQSPRPGEKLVGWTENRDDQSRLMLNAVYAPASFPYTYLMATIKPQDFTIRVDFRNHLGKPHDDLNRAYQFLAVKNHYLNFFDFYPFSIVNDLQKKDLNGDGESELLLFTHQASGMFPSLLTIAGRNRADFRTVFSPGFFDWQSVTSSPRPDPSSPPPLALLAQSNPFCHYMIWAWNITESKTLLPPAYDAVGINYIKTQDLIILPQRSRLTRNEWAKGKGAAFLSPDSNISLELSNDGRISIKGMMNGGFTEDFTANSVALSSLNRCFFHLSRWQTPLAVSAMEKLDTTGLHNPWLKSLISYFQAETALQNDDPLTAETFYHTALKHDPDNGDARNRLTELAVLRHGPEAGLISLDQNSQYSGHFWGLGQGQQLFRACCQLMMGKTEAASQSLSSLADPEKAENRDRLITLQGLSLLYQPDRSELAPVLSRLLQPQSILSCLLDITEQQLILSRLWMMNGEWQKAEPMLRQFVNQTVLHKFFSETSLAWCEAEAGKIETAIERAEQAFTQIRHMAKSQFWARYWLFYDAYAYGRTMEKVGQPDKAREGYRLCAQLAPRSFLGQEALNKITVK